MNINYPNFPVISRQCLFTVYMFSSGRHFESADFVKLNNYNMLADMYKLCCYIF